MFPSTALLSIILLAVSAVNAIPMHRGTDILRVTTRMNTRRVSGLNTVDSARAYAMQRRDGTSVSVQNAAGTYFTTEIGVGSPPTTHTFTIDTGSSNTWIASSAYTATSSSTDTGNAFNVVYSNSMASGEEWEDSLTFDSGLVIQQSIGVASSPSSQYYTDGVLGIGPKGLTAGTISGISASGSTLVPTVTDTLFNQKLISVDAVGIYSVPGPDNDPGELTFGGADASKITSSLTYVPITTTAPSNTLWGYDQSITYGSTTILQSTAGIIDTSLTYIFLAADAFSAYQTATGATLDGATGLLTITADQYSALQPLNFNIGGQTFSLNANGQIWPRSLNVEVGGGSSNIYLVVASSGLSSGSGQDFMMGVVFLQRFYVVLDTTNNRIGFATTSYTDNTTIN